MKLHIVRDEDARSPREDDNFGTMVCWHPRYTLGDEQIKGDEAKEFHDDLPKGSVVLPLYLYDHSGITMSTGSFSCSWDSGQVGFIYITPEKLAEFHGLKELPLRDGKIDSAVEEQTKKFFVEEVGIYDKFLTGDVWGFVLKSECGECGHETETEDSCFGFFGDDKEGIKDHLDEKYWPQLEAAWENRV